MDESPATEAQPESRQGLGEFLLAGFTLLVVVLGVRAMWTSKRSLQELGEVLSEAYSADLAFEREIGYGGLIHNFKNAVLRHDEPQYLAAARENAERADELLSALEHAGQSLGIEADWTESRSMVEAYAAGLDRMAAGERSALDAELLDEEVRINDGPALLERDAARQAVTQAVLARLASARASTLSGLTVLGLSALGLLVFGLATHQARRNASQLKRASNALELSLASAERANSALQQFAGIASHHLSKPIRHVHIFSELIDEDASDPAAIANHTTRIRASLDRMSSLVRRLLEFTRDGFRNPRCQDIDMQAFMEELQQQVEPDLGASAGQLAIARLEPFHADPDLLVRVFINLIDNAIKYRDKERPLGIEIASSRRPQGVEYCVSDNGIGIEPRVAERIFQPMTRLHGPQSEYPGFGLGLSLVKSIVESHGGQIRLDTAHSPGCRFVFSLPDAA